MNAKSKTYSNENLVLLATRIVRAYYYPDHSKHSPDWILVMAIRELLSSHPNISPEELFDLLITQSNVKSKGVLSRYLVKSMTAGIASSRGGHFTGSRRFSFARFAAMALLLIPAGNGVSKVKLNQLFFYCDFTHFFIHRSSISGAKYLRKKGGPVLQDYDELLKRLERSGIVRLTRDPKQRAVRIVDDRPATDKLTFLELVTMYWVNSNFGSMSTAEISGYSHRESVYRFTRQDDFIAYEYAQLLRTLPEQVAS